MIAPLARMEHRIYNRGRNRPYAMTDWRRFLDQVFEDWDTNSGDLDAPPLAPTRFHETNVKVGKLKYDHPPTLEFPGALQPPARLHNALVFLSFTTKAVGDMVEFMWKDADGKFVGRYHVELTVPSLSVAIYQAIERYDASRRDAYAQFNKQQVIHQARRRIVMFAEQGTAGAIDHTVWAMAPQYIEPELAYPRIRHMTAELAAVIELKESANH